MVPHGAMILTAILFAATVVATPVPPPPDLTTPPAENERVLVTGNGTEHPAETDVAKLRFTVWNSDGKMLENVAAPQYALLPVAKLIPGWRNAVMKMVVNERRRTWIPSSLSDGKIKEGEMWVIDAELVEILHPPVTPADVAAPPADAIRTKSGLAYKVLRAGTGAEHPKRRNRVRVHYSGWTTDGNLFDSSVLRDEPATFALGDVIPGWTEGLQLMTVGERTRFWIPSKLAYGNDKTKPQGMLVFDIELLAIE